MKQKGINWRTGGTSLLQATIALQAVNRSFMQTTVTILGSDIVAITRSLQEREVNDYLPEGMQNVADIDPRLFNIAATDLPTGFNELSSVTWLGTDYTLVRKMPDPAAGAVRLIGYRTPASVTATQAPAGEPDAGQRKRYAPPAVTD